MKEENILDKIIKKRIERKKQNEVKRERYWKLPAVERLHYDSKLKEIKDNSPILFQLTKSYLILLIYITTFVVFLHYMHTTGDKDLLPLFNDIVSLTYLLFKLTFIPICVDIILLLFDKTNSNIKKLNKRFKLI